MTNKIELFSLGQLWISDFIRKGEQPRGGKHELKLVMAEDTRAVRLATSAPLETMFGEYWYKSGLNPQMVSQLKDVVESILPLMKFEEGDIFCDIASNDGTLLSFVPDTFIKIGIDPIEDKFKKEAEQHADLIIQQYFSAVAYEMSKFGEHKIKVLTAVAMFYDVENPDKFLKDVYEVLDDEGLFVMQLSHSGLMIHQCAFDNILSEHIFYYDLLSLQQYLYRNGFKVVDVSLNETNGGSFRVYIRKQIANDELFATQPYRDVCYWRIESLLWYEKLIELNKPETWMKFYNQIQDLKGLITGFINSKKKEGKTIWGMAASTKGNTLLQYFELDNTLIDGICERNPDKFGLYTVGTNIPIYSEEEFRKAQPDFVLILAWHFVSSFLKRYSDYIENGGAFIIPMPQFKIINKNNL